MARADADPATTLRNLINGFQVSQAIHAAATLGLADLLVDGPRSSSELAEASGANADALYRLLRALAAAGILDEQEEKRFALTPLGEHLRRDVPESLHGWAAYVGRRAFRDAWTELPHTVRTGENGFRHAHGAGVWEWRSARPDEQAVFDRAMQSVTSVTNRSLLEAYDFSRFRTLVDVGGGNGTLLATVLARYPELNGVLFDLPQTVTDELLVAAGVGDRVRVVGGSFFESVPEGGDAYLLKSIIHDWEDAEAVEILSTCRHAMEAGASILLVERDLAYASTAFSDLMMLVVVGGRERTVGDYGALFATSGFRLAGVTPTTSGMHVIEGVAE